MKNYKRLSIDEREEISRMFPLDQIARLLGCYVSTINY